WEGLWQAMPEDAGNWVALPGGGRRLVGTMRGVTPAAFARWRGLQPWQVDAGRMKAEITLDVAVTIGLEHYYRQPGFDRLEWSPLVEIAVDIGWGSGPVRGIRMLQVLVGAEPDGIIGPRTEAAYAAAIGRAMGPGAGLG